MISYSLHSAVHSSGAWGAGLFQGGESRWPEARAKARTGVELAGELRKAKALGRVVSTRLIGLTLISGRRPFSITDLVL